MRDDCVDDTLYDDDEAVEVITDSISEELRGKISKEDILVIIDLEFQYLESVNLLLDPDKPSLVNYMADLDGDALDSYVIEKALKHGIYLSLDELQEIWEGEDVYYEMNGMLSELPLDELN